MKKAGKIKRAAIGIFALIIIGVIIFFALKYKKAQENTDENDVEYDEEDDYDEEETINLDEEEELFKRVNKAKFKPIEEMNKKNEFSPKINQSEQESKEIVENYFRSLEDKRKGKHF